MIQLTASTRHFEVAMKKASKAVRAFGATIRQYQVLHHITAYIAVKGRPPTIREIQAYFGFQSTNSVTAHLDALERKGLIRREPNKSRNIEVLSKCSNSNKPENAVE